MPQQAWSNKRERQYEHIKSGARKRGESEGRAEEIAARTVNKNRARSGESRQAVQQHHDLPAGVLAPTGRDLPERHGVAVQCHGARLACHGP